MIVTLIVACEIAFWVLLAAGLAFTVAAQVFVVVAGVTKLLPRTGLTTPFLSYGGSAVLADYALLALLIRISDAARAPAPSRRKEAGPISNPPTEILRTDSTHHQAKGEPA